MSEDRMSDVRQVRRLLLKLLGAASASALLPGCGNSDGPLLPPSPGSNGVQRVVIVGAGMAGLAAANALANVGVTSIVLEARDRIGGRLWTRDLGGSPIDLGGSWIHNPMGNPMTAFASSAGVGQTAVDPTQDLAQFTLYQEESGLGSVDDVAAAFAHYDLFEAATPDLLNRLGPQASIRDAILQYVTDNSAALLPEQQRLITHVLRFIQETFDSGTWDSISLDQHVNAPTASYGGSAFGDFPDGGYVRLVHAMAANADIRLNHRVTRIAATDRGVTVSVDTVVNGQTVPVSFDGSHVLVTLPLGVLKNADVAFDPPLSEPKLSAISRVGFGHFEKVALRFDQPFWTGGTPPGSHFYFRSASTTEPTEFPFFLDLQKSLNLPVLVALTSGAFAQDFLTIPESAIRARIMAILREAYGNAIPEPTQVLISNWGSDEFTRGAYSYLPLGATADDMDTLAEPHGQRVLFAGEATYKQRFGYADGALSSALREVNRLLGLTNAAVTPGP